MAQSVFQGNSPNETVLAESYSFCAEIVNQASTSFARSFRHLPQEKRNAVHALYAFCRRVDDIVDGDWLPDIISSKKLDKRAKQRTLELRDEHGVNPVCDENEFFIKVRALMWFRENLKLISKNKPVNHPIFIALNDAVSKFPINIENLHTLINGMEDDLFPTEYHNFEDMRKYCYKVASTVGLSLIEVYGYTDPNARGHAEEMGIFMQMVNILRDIQEDRKRGRLYLPLHELEKFNITPDELDSPTIVKTEKWKEFMRHYVHRTKTHLNNAIPLLSLLNRDSRRSPAIICNVYRGFLNEATRRRGDVLTRRLSLGFIQKIKLAMASLGLFLYSYD